MLPVLVSIGPITIYTLLLIMLLAVVAFFYVVWRRGRDLHFEEVALFDTVLVALVWFFIGARIGYILLHINDFSIHPTYWVNIFGKPGLWLPTGWLAGTMSLYLQARHRKWDFYLLTDVVVPAAALVQTLMAFGAFLNGTGYGRETMWWIGVQFPHLYEKRLPIQLVEMLWFGGLYACLWWVEGAYRTFSWYKGNKSEARSGFVTACYLIGAGLGLWLMSLLRAQATLLFSIAIEPWLYMVVSFGGVYLLYRRWGGSFRRSQSKWRDTKHKKDDKVEALILGKNIFE